MVSNDYAHKFDFVKTTSTSSIMAMLNNQEYYQSLKSKY